MNYEPSDTARGEIKYLSAIMNEDLSKYKPEEILAEAGIPILQSVPQADAPQGTCDSPHLHQNGIAII